MRKTDYVPVLQVTNDAVQPIKIVISSQVVRALNCSKTQTFFLCCFKSILALNLEHKVEKYWQLQ
jgi:hypothetical protein